MIRDGYMSYYRDLSLIKLEVFKSTIKNMDMIPSWVMFKTNVDDVMIS